MSPRVIGPMRYASVLIKHEFARLHVRQHRGTRDLRNPQEERHPDREQDDDLHVTRTA